MKIWVFLPLAFVWPSKNLLAFFLIFLTFRCLEYSKSFKFELFRSNFASKQFLLKNSQTGSVWYILEIVDSHNLTRRYLVIDSRWALISPCDTSLKNKNLYLFAKRSTIWQRIFWRGITLGFWHRTPFLPWQFKNILVKLRRMHVVESRNALSEIFSTNSSSAHLLEWCTSFCLTENEKRLGHFFQLQQTAKAVQLWVVCSVLK